MPDLAEGTGWSLHSKGAREHPNSGIPWHTLFGRSLALRERRFTIDFDMAAPPVMGRVSSPSPAAIRRGQLDLRDSIGLKRGVTGENEGSAESP
jgi:hypothetical protein